MKRKKNRKMVSAWFFSATHYGLKTTVVYAGSKTKKQAEEWAKNMRDDPLYPEKTGPIVKLSIPAP